VTRILEIHPAALAEAEGAARWYAERNPAAAEAFTVELDAAVAALEREPHVFPAYEHATCRVLLHRFPFSVVLAGLPEGESSSSSRALRCARGLAPVR
jgi:plasmid stabilization system protein ParE